MLRSVWLSPSPRGVGSFFSIVADVFLVTIPFPLIVIFIILAAVMIRFITAGSAFLHREQRGSHLVLLLP